MEGFPQTGADESRCAESKRKLNQQAPFTVNEKPTLGLPLARATVGALVVVADLAAVSASEWA